MLKLKELPILERPYEKLELYGAEKLSNAELLGIIIKSGTKNETAVSLAQRILSMKKTNEKDELRFLQEITIEEFMNIKGIGKVKAVQLKALCEITKRMSAPVHSNTIIIKSTIDIVNLFMEELRYEKREIVKLIALSSKNVILRIINISYGGTNLAVIEPKEVLLEAIKMQAPRIILLHNHPSGDPTPSKEDYRITERISDCADLLGIELLDHVVIGDGVYRSILYKQ